LLIETATSAAAPLATAQFRWTDCDTARTVDEIPVYLAQEKNSDKFKGTRVSVLGLRDIDEWRRPDRIYDITRSLAKLISPFEATSIFPVNVSLDGVEQSLVTITDEVLKQAIVLTPRRWCQVGGSNSAGDGGQKARAPGSARIIRKPLRGECRVIPV
jgi:hypothetical protein